MYSKYIMTCYLIYLKCCYTQFSSVPVFYFHVRLLTSQYICKCQFEQIIWIYNHPACFVIVTYTSITVYLSHAPGLSHVYLVASGLFILCVFGGVRVVHLMCIWWRQGCSSYVYLVASGLLILCVFGGVMVVHLMCIWWRQGCSSYMYLLASGLFILCIFGGVSVAHLSFFSALCGFFLLLFCFVWLRSVSCFMCLWFVYSWLCLRCSLTLFIYEYTIIQPMPPLLLWPPPI
jgi:hypothetical protein